MADLSPGDPLAPLLGLADVDAALQGARAAVDAALRHPALRRSGGPVAAEVALRCAVASAALEGHGYDLEAARAGVVTDPLLQGALRVSAALSGLAPRWMSAPRQVLARLHVLAARGTVDEAELGRPLSTPQVSVRLDALVDLLTGAGGAPALLRAAVVHGELLALGAFAGANGIVARAAGRLTLVATGLDPRCLIALDVGHLAREPEYVGSAAAFATGTRDGVRSWLKHYALATELAAAELSAVAEAVTG
jgi:hypothetical protein